MEFHAWWLLHILITTPHHSILNVLTSFFCALPSRHFFNISILATWQPPTSCCIYTIFIMHKLTHIPLIASLECHMSKTTWACDSFTVCILQSLKHEKKEVIEWDWNWNCYHDDVWRSLAHSSPFFVSVILIFMFTLLCVSSSKGLWGV